MQQASDKKIKNIDYKSYINTTLEKRRSNVNWMSIKQKEPAHHKPPFQSILAHACCINAGQNAKGDNWFCVWEQATIECLLITPLLLQQCGEELQVTKDLGVQLIENDHCDADIIKYLLHFRDNLPITEKVVLEAAGNYGVGRKILQLLFDCRGSELLITLRNDLVAFIKKLGYKFKYYNQVQQDGSNADGRITGG